MRPFFKRRSVAWRYRDPGRPPQRRGAAVRQIAVSRVQLVDLQARLANTRWPEYGPSLAAARRSVGRWQNGYDWCTCERLLNSVGQLPTYSLEVTGGRCRVRRVEAHVRRFRCPSSMHSTGLRAYRRCVCVTIAQSLKQVLDGANDEAHKARIPHVRKCARDGHPESSCESCLSGPRAPGGAVWGVSQSVGTPNLHARPGGRSAALRGGQRLTAGESTRKWLASSPKPLLLQSWRGTKLRIGNVEVKVKLRRRAAVARLPRRTPLWF